MFVKLLFITLVIIALVFIGLALQILLKKNGKFPEIHIGHNKEMKKRNIFCAKIIDKKEYANQKQTHCCKCDENVETTSHNQNT